LKHAAFEHGIRREMRIIEACTYEQLNQITYLMHPCSRAYRVILIPLTSHVPTANRRMNHSEKTSENSQTTHESVNAYSFTVNIKTLHGKQVRKTNPEAAHSQLFNVPVSYSPRGGNAVHARTLLRTGIRAGQAGQRLRSILGVTAYSSGTLRTQPH